MKACDCDGFWEGGDHAWWTGLRDALRAAADRLKSAKSDAERTQAQAALDRLNEQQADAQRNGHRWLF